MSSHAQLCRTFSNHVTHDTFLTGPATPTRAYSNKTDTRSSYRSIVWCPPVDIERVRQHHYSPPADHIIEHKHQNIQLATHACILHTTSSHGSPPPALQNLCTAVPQPTLQCAVSAAPPAHLGCSSTRYGTQAATPCRAVPAL